MAVDSAGASGWKWFENKYGLTSETFEDLLITNQKKADNLDKVKETVQAQTDNGLIEYLMGYRTLIEEHEQLKQKLEKIREYIIGRDKEEYGTHPDWSNLRKILEDKS